jgi:hypothetical protein
LSAGQLSGLGDDEQITQPVLFFVKSESVFNFFSPKFVIIMDMQAIVRLSTE